MDKFKRYILIKEFEKFLTDKFGYFKKEAVFKNFMDTDRKFRADYLLLKDKIIIEINGGQYINGRHNRGGIGYENDLTKLNIAQKNGFKIYQFTYEMINRREYYFI